MAKLKHNRFIKFIFFGNYFYGLCAIALSIEGALQHHLPPVDLLYMILAFSATLVFYSKAYIMTEVSDDIANLRSMWYARNKQLMNFTQLLFTGILAGASLYFLYSYWNAVLELNLLEWFLILIFPCVSGLYYGVDNKLFGTHNLRNVGWLKPFIIGFTWAGLVTIYPVLFYDIQHELHYVVNPISAFLFVKNFMFITILCIMFDIKDYAMDYNQQLKTVVVKLGLRRTIFYFIIPLCVIGLGSYWVNAMLQHFSMMKILIHTIPFLAIISVAYSMYSRRSIFYYLMVIDGLMLLKALCGIVAMIYF